MRSTPFDTWDNLRSKNHNKSSAEPGATTRWGACFILRPPQAIFFKRRNHYHQRWSISFKTITRAIELPTCFLISRPIAGGDIFYTDSRNCDAARRTRDVGRGTRDTGRGTRPGADAQEEEVQEERMFDPEALAAGIIWPCGLTQLRSHARNLIPWLPHTPTSDIFL